jgi:hypothetical protein
MQEIREEWLASMEIQNRCQRIISLMINNNWIELERLGERFPMAG